MKIKSLILLTVALGAASVTHAYNHLWLGASSDAWSNAQNWTNGAVNPTENRAIRLFFPINFSEETMRQDIDGLAVDHLEFRGTYIISGGPGVRLGFRNTNADPATTTIHGAAGYFTFADDLELRLNQRVNVSAYFDGRPNVIGGQFNGRITGPGDLYLGGGRVEFAGSQANTYTGVTVTTADTLRLNKTGAIAVPGDLVIGVGPGGGNNPKDKVILAQNSQLAANAQVTVNGSGWLNLDGHNQALAGLNLTAAQVSTDLGTLSLGGNVTSQPGNVESLIEGRVALGFVPRTFTVGGISPTNGLRITARVSGDSGASVLKQGDGWLTLEGANTYHGQTTVNEGILRVTAAGTLGSLVQGTKVNDGGTLYLLQSDIGEEPLTLEGDGSNGQGALYGLNGTASGNITLPAAEASIGAWPGSTLELSGVIAGPGDLRLKSGTLQLAGTSANTFTGVTRVDGGTLELRKQILIISGSIGLVAVPGPLVIGDGTGTDTVRLFTGNAIAATAPVTLADNGLLDLNGNTGAIGSLSSQGGQVDLGSGELVIGGNGLSTTSGATIFGGGRVRKVGTGTLTLTAQNTINLGTFVEGGTLVVNGSVGNVSVKTNGTLAGVGILGALAVQGGTVSPGVGPGRLNSKGVVFNSAATGSVFRVELNGAVASVSYDQLNVTGSVNLAASTLDASLGFAGAPGNQYVIIANDGADAVIGTFAGKPQGATFTAGGAQFQIHYQGGDGNDVVLTQLTASTQDFAPALAIEKSVPGQIRLLWTANAVGFHLETAATLPAVWSAVPGVPNVVADRYAIDVPATTNAGFFRLTKP